MRSTEDRFERLDIRSKWEDEARHFTPWLANNIDLVGNLIGKRLKFEEREKPIGSFWKLDILAIETDTGTLVAIENQFGLSDSDHLGRTIAYSTGLDARIVIWIAEGFWREHAEVLHRLNEWTRDGIEFYGLKIELVRKIADSNPEPRLLQVVYPGGFDLKSTLQAKEKDPIIQQYAVFFEPLIYKLSETGFAESSPVTVFDHTDRFYESKLNQGIWYGVSLERNNTAWVTVHIRTESNEMTKSLFDKLHNNRKQIESSVIVSHGLDWHWRKHDNKRDRFSSISVRKEASINDPVYKLQETRVWMLDLLPKLKAVFEPRIAQLIMNLE